MRAPSVKSLQSTFDLTAKEAKLVRALAKAVDGEGPKDLDELVEEHLPETERYVRSMYSDPYRSHMWRVTVALHGINEIMGAHGVEPLGPVEMHYGPPFEYINMGDTYVATLVYDRDKDRLFISSWGDIAERYSRKWGDEGWGSPGLGLERWLAQELREVARDDARETFLEEQLGYWYSGPGIPGEPFPPRPQRGWCGNAVWGATFERKSCSTEEWRAYRDAYTQALDAAIRYVDRHFDPDEEDPDHYDDITDGAVAVIEDM
jgi:hypothetical protein